MLQTLRDRGRRRQLLGQPSQSCVEGERSFSPPWGTNLDSTGDGHRARRSTTSCLRNPRAADGSSHVSFSLYGYATRRDPAACGEVARDPTWSKGRVDDKPRRRSRRGSRRRRVGSPQRRAEASTRRRPSGTWEGGRRGRGTGAREEEEKTQEGEAQGTRAKGSEGTPGEHGSRPRGEGQTSIQEESGQDSKEEEGEVRGEFRKLLHQLQRRRERRSDSLRKQQPHSDHLQTTTRDFSQLSVGRSSRGYDTSRRRRVGLGEWQPASSIHSLLSTTSTAKDVTCNGPRGPHPEPVYGQPTEGSGGRSSGPLLTTSKGPRDASPRGSLLRGSTAGAVDQRLQHLEHDTRVQGSSKVGKRREQSKMGGKQTLRSKRAWSKQRRQRRFLGTLPQWRKERWRKEQRRQGRRKEARCREERCKETKGGREVTPVVGVEMRGAEAGKERAGADEETGWLLAPAKPEKQQSREVRPLDDMIGLPPGKEEERGESMEHLATAGEEFKSGPTAKPEMGQFHGSQEAPFTSLSNLSFPELGGPILSLLQQMVWERRGKNLSKAKDNLYPLPLRGYHRVPPTQELWLQAILLALNSLYGESQPTADRPTVVQQKMVEGIMDFLNRCCNWVDRVPQSNFADLFQVKGIDYRGEEVQLARYFNWSCIEAALPSEVGTLNLVDFCTGGCKSFIEDFSKFLLPEEIQQISRPPRIMVEDKDWFEVCKGLLSKGVCGVLPRRFLYHVHGKCLLNGMFAVSKNEYQGPIELHRLIMNLVPLNSLCRSLKGDVGTLPTVAGFSAFYLLDSEVAIMSSEDVKCFYYLFTVPEEWQQYMGFDKTVDASLVPPKWRREPCHLVARVLPMGWVNSVGLAQHVHRNVVRWSMEATGSPTGAEQEIRRDKPSSASKNLFRVYLDNWDQVRKVDRTLRDLVVGTPSPSQLALRQQYNQLNLPRHPKKAVGSQLKAEIQGALLDGEAGVAYAKPEKILKYLNLAWEVVQRGYATQRELQVVAGGLVYITMFRRPLLCSLNAIWGHIESLKTDPPVVKRPVPREVKLELVRFLALIPLAQMDFRVRMRPDVTASDASSSGGGFCVSQGLTSYGKSALLATIRGEQEELFEPVEVLTVGLFDGIGALRVATDCLRLPVAGHVSVECNEAASRVVESAFPGSRLVKSVAEVTEEEVKLWACEHTSVGVVLLGAGPPCQDVSKLNVDRRGSQKGARSSLYKEIPRIFQLVQKHFPWAQIHRFVESVASMDSCDRAAMSEDLGLLPVQVDSAGLSLARRPRLYWMSWEFLPEEGAEVTKVTGEGWERVTHLQLTADIDPKDYLQAGWFVPTGQKLATFTTSRPSPVPGRRPAGLHTCDEGALSRWRLDNHRFPPYQYKAEFGVHHLDGRVRVADIAEREVIMGFPLHYTQFCTTKALRVGTHYDDLRKTLLGNSWSVPVVANLLKSLFQPLGLMQPVSVQGVVDRLTPGKGDHLQSVLLRAPLRRADPVSHVDDGLAERLAGLVSVKGEDLLLQAPSENVVKFQRFRSTVPSKLWKWREVAGWAWTGTPEHISTNWS